jgi:rhodanese-related sulfurtransferase
MRIKILLIVALLLTSVTALAQNYNIPNLTVDEVKKQIDQPGKVLLVDTRTEEEYRQAHILTAVSANICRKTKACPSFFTVEVTAEDYPF